MSRQPASRGAPRKPQMQAACLAVSVFEAIGCPMCRTSVGGCGPEIARAVVLSPLRSRGRGWGAATSRLALSAGSGRNVPWLLCSGRVYERAKAHAAVGGQKDSGLAQCDSNDKEGCGYMIKSLCRLHTHVRLRVNYFQHLPFKSEGAGGNHDRFLALANE